jgi:hypothetical protein
LIFHSLSSMPTAHAVPREMAHRFCVSEPA